MKHIGRHGDRKVAIVYKSLPGQEHMALVLYTESMGTAMHDSLMRVIESKEGQAENELSEILHRSLFNDGRQMLVTIHKEGMLKKAECKQIIVTPDAKNSVRLDELNKILTEIESGQGAAQRLADLDKNAGLVDPRERRVQEASNNVIEDPGLAKNQLDQAIKMESESKSLLEESKRLKEEAFQLDPSLRPPKRKYTKRKITAKKVTAKKKTKA
jgi:hypothetical protein